RPHHRELEAQHARRRGRKRRAGGAPPGRPRGPGRGGRPAGRRGRGRGGRSGGRGRPRPPRGAGRGRGQRAETRASHPPAPPAMARVCEACGTENPDVARFCLACGAALGGGPAKAPVRERKFATALFADLVGSTSLGEREDPEVVQSLIAGTLRRLTEEVERYGGIVDK